MKKEDSGSKDRMLIKMRFWQHTYSLLKDERAERAGELVTGLDILLRLILLMP